MSTVPVKNMQGEQVGEYEFADSLLVFDRGVQAVHDVVVAYRAHQRQGTASTLEKGEVAGSNRKPWRQKGLGRARAGYRQSPVWRGGSVVFGPNSRRTHKRMPRKVARLAFRRAVSDRIAAGEVVVLEALELTEPRTREVAAMLRRMEAARGALLLAESPDDTIVRSCRNIRDLTLARADEVNTYDLLGHPVVIATRESADVLVQRLRRAAGEDV